MSRLKSKAMKKLYALKKLGEHLGMYGKIRYKIDSDPMEVMVIFMNYLRDDISIIRKYALALLLDFYLPEWREIVGTKLLGPIIERGSGIMWHWKKEVIKRDGECMGCGSIKNLEAHHIIPWSEAPELRADPENGLTQCVKCHSDNHKELKGFILSRKNLE